MSKYVDLEARGPPDASDDEMEECEDDPQEEWVNTRELLEDEDGASLPSTMPLSGSESSDQPCKCTTPWKHENMEEEEWRAMKPKKRARKTLGPRKARPASSSRESVAQTLDAFIGKGPSSSSTRAPSNMPASGSPATGRTSSKEEDRPSKRSPTPPSERLANYIQDLGRIGTVVSAVLDKVGEAISTARRSPFSEDLHVETILRRLSLTITSEFGRAIAISTQDTDVWFALRRQCMTKSHEPCYFCTGLADPESPFSRALYSNGGALSKERTTTS
jgi:hypothetical protein